MYKTIILAFNPSIPFFSVCFHHYLDTHLSHTPYWAPFHLLYPVHWQIRQILLVWILKTIFFSPIDTNLDEILIVSHLVWSPFIFTASNESSSHCQSNLLFRESVSTCCLLMLCCILTFQNWLTVQWICIDMWEIWCSKCYNQCIQKEP